MRWREARRGRSRLSPGLPSSRWCRARGRDALQVLSGISVRILEDLGDEVGRRVAAGEADFGLPSYVRPSNEMDSSFLLKDQIGVLCAKNHPLVRRRSLTWKDLTGFPFATLSQGTPLRQVIDKHPDIGAVLPRPNYEASSISSLVALVAQGAGIALLRASRRFRRSGRTSPSGRCAGRTSFVSCTLCRRGGAR